MSGPGRFFKGEAKGDGYGATELTVPSNVGGGEAEHKIEAQNGPQHMDARLLIDAGAQAQAQNNTFSCSNIFSSCRRNYFAIIVGLAITIAVSGLLGVIIYNAIQNRQTRGPRLP